MSGGELEKRYGDTGDQQLGKDDLDDRLVDSGVNVRLRCNLVVGASLLQLPIRRVGVNSDGHGRILSACGRGCRISRKPRLRASEIDAADAAQSSPEQMYGVMPIAK